MKKLLSFIILGITLSSCSSTKNLKFTQKSDDIVTTESLRRFLQTNKKPKVVLRVNNSSSNITQKENNNYLYNAIENQLLASGFIVRDRQLFNQVIDNKENNIDYQKLKEKSDTDLIIELTKLKDNILYETNKYYDKNNIEKVEKSSEKYRRYGASVEFKVVMLQSNEFAGIYEFNYTPCSQGKGCPISKTLKQQIKERKKMKKEKKEGYEGVEKNVLEDFIKGAVKKLVNEMRK